MKRSLSIILVLCALMGRTPPVLRLHVIANSDSDLDQSVKLQVRDAIVAYLQQDMLNAENLNDAQAYVEDHLDKVKNIADSVLAQNGFAYQSTVRVCIDEFPEKSYDGVVFPAGSYHAVRIVLGKGEGHNWWCVLFPPLCLLDAKQVDPNWQPSDGVTYKSWLLSLFQ